MRFYVNEYLSLIASLNQLTYYLHDIFQQGRFRTVMIYYENQTSSTTSMLIKKICDNNITYFGYLSFNVDEVNAKPITTYHLGSEYFNIFMFDNIVDKKYQTFSERLFFDPRFHNIYLSRKEATDEEISDFFRNIWRDSVLNAGLIFWNNVFKIYTHFPYQNQFKEQIFFANETQAALPSDVFDTLFERKADNLGKTSVNVFITTDPPKVYLVPARYRIGPVYHFGGRDGLIAALAENVLNATWKYRTVSKHYGIISFKMIDLNRSMVTSDRYGNKLIERANNSNVIRIRLNQNARVR